MKIIRNPKKLHDLLEQERSRGKSVGFVPTMGALHKGHLSLVRGSNRENDITVVSIFVNPTQFGPKEDYTKYPRVLGADSEMLRRTGTDYLFCPAVGAMYPEGLAKPRKIKGAKWPRLAKGLCGKFRPGHFQGVVTVVAKLLGITGACWLYLGAKDYQQVAVICQMVKDLGMDVKVRMLPTVRERDGLAMSSRNRYLSRADRRRAVAISRTLFEFCAGVLRKKMSLQKLKVQAVRGLTENVDLLQYFAVVDPVTLVPLKGSRRPMAVLTACFVGKTRLIDNVIIPAQSFSRGAKSL
ncbi:MAG TPA: pantoate--beta-alanine ligase [Candidatus Omnitrophota bacterium]|nr:pantoate--beta-alanine ligase [Candidatus Omnitrophota bacterium]HPS37374.1 pantoate--beta-alanine ligase [Candidatus Omnitrophota bacterium]